MKNKEIKKILEKVIKKAVKNGWDIGIMKEYDWEAVDVARGVYLYEKGSPRGKENDGFIDAMTIIFNHNFAKAFWGEGKSFACSDCKDSNLEAWQCHLRRMVLEKNPIKYLEQFICKTECEYCHSKTVHYYDCKLIRAERIRKINEIKNPWDLSWNDLSDKLDKIL